MKKIIIILLILVIYTKTQAESPFSFLRTNMSARSGALAGASVTLKNDASSVFFNPSLAYTVENKELNFTFLKHVLDINSGNVSYIYKGLSNGVLAGNVAFTNYGSFDYRDATGKADGRTFSGNNLSAGITYANELDTNFFYGVTAKFVYAGIEEASTSAVAFDAGIVYKMKYGRTTLGASILNAGFQISKFNGISDKLPLDVRLGVNHRLKGLPLLINFNLHHLADSTESFIDRFKNFSIGGEFYFGKYLQARLGYDNQIRSFVSNEISKGFSGFNFGAGIMMEDFNIDYSFSQYGSAAILHRFSIAVDLK